MTPPRRRTLAAFAAMLLAGCSAPRASTVPPAAAPSGPPITYAAVGASETVGAGADEPLREAWPRVFFRTALPEQAVFVNLGIPGATVADALREEVPMVAEVEPQVVTVWLNVNDIAAGVSPAQYERDLATLVRTLRGNGSTRVLVANVPPLDQLPAYVNCRTDGAICDLAERLPDPGALNRTVDAYNAAIQRVVAEEGAVLVDLHATGLAAQQSGTAADLVSADGFHPSTAGHAAAAEAFAQALRDSGPLTPSG
jgi:acyl-CoA thioesterase-1